MKALKTTIIIFLFCLFLIPKQNLSQIKYHVLSSIPKKGELIKLNDSSLVLTFDSLPTSDFNIQFESLDGREWTAVYTSDNTKIQVNRNKNQLIIDLRLYTAYPDGNRGTFISSLKYNTEYALLINLKFTNYTFRTVAYGQKKIRDTNELRPLYDISRNPGMNQFHKDKLKEAYPRQHFNKKYIYDTVKGTGQNINVAVVDQPILRESDIGNAVVFTGRDIPENYFTAKSYNSVENKYYYYNHGIEMCRYVLDYAPKTNIFDYSKSIMNPTYLLYLTKKYNIDVFSLSGSFFNDSREQYSATKTLIDSGLIISKSLGNESLLPNILSNYNNKSLFLPYFLNLDNSKGAFVTLQAVIYDTPNLLYHNRRMADITKGYTLTIIENGIGATSAATATFSGIVSLLLDINKKRNSGFTPREVVECLFQTATDIGDPGVDNIYGHGLVNVKAAADMVYNGVRPTFKLYQNITNTRRNEARDTLELQGVQNITSDVYQSGRFDTADAFTFIENGIAIERQVVTWKHPIDSTIAYVIDKPGDISNVDTTYFNNPLFNKEINIFNTLNKKFIVYPNPTNGTFTIELTSSSKGKITIFNLLGEVAYNKSFLGNKINVNLPSNFSKGVYILKIGTENHNFEQKIIISK